MQRLGSDPLLSPSICISRIVVLLLLCILLVELTATFSPATETPLPTSPPGYTRQQCREISCAFLKPAGWHYKHVVRKGQHACFITKEDIDAEGSFQTGLTVNLILMSHLKTGLPASEYASRFIETATSRKETLKRWASAQGPFQAQGCVIRDASAGPPVIVHNIFVSASYLGQSRQSPT